MTRDFLFFCDIVFLSTTAERQNMSKDNLKKAKTKVKEVKKAVDNKVKEVKKKVEKKVNEVKKKK